MSRGRSGRRRRRLGDDARVADFLTQVLLPLGEVVQLAGELFIFLAEKERGRPLSKRARVTMDVFLTMTKMLGGSL